MPSLPSLSGYNSRASGDGNRVPTGLVGDKSLSSQGKAAHDGVSEAGLDETTYSEVAYNNVAHGEVGKAVLGKVAHGGASKAIPIKIYARIGT